LFTGIVQAGLDEAVNDGFATEADYQGATSGLLGDFDDDGAVTVSDLLTFLSLFGDIYESDEDLFSASSIYVRCDDDQFVAVDSGNKTTLTFASEDAVGAVPGTNGINVNASDNNIEFVSGTGLPITSWPTKVAKILNDAPGHMFEVKTSFPDQAFDFIQVVKTYNAQDVLVDTIEHLLGTFTVDNATGLDDSIPVTTIAISFQQSLELISDQTVTRIQVSVAVQAANGSTRDFEARINRLHFKLV